MQDGNERSPQPAEYYVDTVLVNWNVFSVELQGGIGDRSSGELSRHEVTLRMSPQLAKALLHVLEEQITKYETAVGSIALPAPNIPHE